MAAFGNSMAKLMERSSVIRPSSSWSAARLPQALGRKERAE
jgi:hypothetical protein